MALHVTRSDSGHVQQKQEQKYQTINMPNTVILNKTLTRYTLQYQYILILNIQDININLMPSRYIYY